MHANDGRVDHLHGSVMERLPKAMLGNRCVVDDNECVFDNIHKIDAHTFLIHTYCKTNRPPQYGEVTNDGGQSHTGNVRYGESLEL